MDTLCPAFEETGNPVVCYPVANYPLGVKASWQPRQEGTGDPSPENVRTIVGLDSVQVTRCGKNQWNYTLDSYGRTWIIPFIPKGTYTFSALSNADWWTGNSNRNKWYLRNEDSSQLIYTVAFNNTIINQRCYANVEIPYSGAFILATYSEQTVASVQDMQVEVGSIATAYEPYQPGTTATLTLPETIYGGTVDAVTGVGVETWAYLVFDGTERWNSYNNPITNKSQYGSAWAVNLPDIQQGDNRVCTHFSTSNFPSWSGMADNNFATDKRYIRVQSPIPTLDEWKSYLAAQYSAGTPVTIAYKLATPTTFQATGNAPIPALPGTNTIYTDADSVTVTGRADPVRMIGRLSERVAALENAAIAP